MIAALFLVIAFSWAVIATCASVEANERAERAEDFAEECLAQVKAARHG